MNSDRIEFVLKYIRYKLWTQWISAPYRNNYDFSTDWFSWNIPIWEKYVGPNLNTDEKIKALEIGTFEGRSALWLLENLLVKPEDELYCVDSDPDSQRKFWENYSKGYFKAQVEFLAMSSGEALAQVHGSCFDLIYVDGSHQTSSVMQDAQASWGLLKKRGLLIFDDYRWKDKKTGGFPVREALTQFMKEKEEQFEIIFMDYQLILKKLI